MAISVLFLKSIYNLKRTQQGIDFDQVILIIELVKVSVDEIAVSSADYLTFFDSIDPALRCLCLFRARVLRPCLLQPDPIHDSYYHMLSLSPSVPDLIGSSTHCQSYLFRVHHTSSLI